jgi:hypothetical protein
MLRQMKSKGKVKLIGQEIDLKKAADYFKTTQFSISKAEDEYFICSDKFNDIKSTNEISKIANSFLEKINGILKLKFQGFNTIALDSLFIFEDENGISKIAAMRATLSGRGDLTAIPNSTGDEVENHINQTEKLINDLIATEVFHFYSQPTSWINLYKIYEIIRDNIGDKRIIQILSKNELSRFTGTAQSRDKIGDDARHSSKKYSGHADPMTIEEANELIKKLIIKWAEASI